MTKTPQPFFSAGVKVKLGNSPQASGPRVPPVEILRSIGDLARQGNIQEAMVQSDKALAAGFVHPMLLNFAALKLEMSGRPEDAIAVLLEARAMAPKDPGTLNALGLVYLRLERFVEALECFEALGGLDPNLAIAHANQGQALQAIGLGDRAEAAFKRALDLAPEHPVSLTGLASLASRRGAHAEAKGYAERVLKGAPMAAEANMCMARAEVDLGTPELAEARLAHLLTDPHITPIEAADARNLIGDILGARGEHDQAFAAYLACNSALRTEYGPLFGTGAGAMGHAQSMARYFQRTTASAWARKPAGKPLADSPRSHVFLMGFPRSGTTLLEVALTGNEDVVTLEEQDALIDGVRQFMRHPDDLDALARASEAELDMFRAAYWRRVREAGIEPSGKVFLDRYPLNTLKLPLIARLFPDAKVLFALRDPRDVVWSCYRRRFQMSPSMYHFLDLEEAARFYDSVMTFKTQLETRLDQDMLVLRHEALLEDFEREVQAICAFIGLEWREAMRDFGARTRSRSMATPSTAQLTRGLSKDGTGHWRSYTIPMARALEVLEPWVQKLGYSEG